MQLLLNGVSNFNNAITITYCEYFNTIALTFLFTIIWMLVMFCCTRWINTKLRNTQLYKWLSEWIIENEKGDQI